MTIQQLVEKVQKAEAPICVGLDPTLSYIPEYIVKKSFHEFEETLEGAIDAIWQFDKEIVDHTFDLIPSARPQIAMYEQFELKGLAMYQKTVRYCQKKGLIVIGDIKRGDIGSTSATYATGHIGHVQAENNSFAGFDTEFITVNLYFGTNDVKPFVDVCNKEDRDLSILVKTSSPLSGEFQDKLIDGGPLYELVAEKVVEWGGIPMDGAYSNVGTMVGAIYPEMSHIPKKLTPNTYFLMSRHGTQGGTAESLKYCFDEDGLEAIVSSSRGIIMAYKQEKYTKFGTEHFAEASRQAVMGMVADINSVLQK